MAGTRFSAVHRALGDAFYALPIEVRRAHDHAGYIHLSGRADVEVAKGLLPRLICWIGGMPRGGANQVVTVDLLTDESEVDRWRRNFNGRRYRSVLKAEGGGGTGRVVEQLGIFTATFDLTALPDRLIYEIVRFKVFGIPLPRWLALQCHAFETGEDGLFVFDITMKLALIGQFVSYRGKLRAAAP